MEELKQETGIKVTYDVFETLEEMYPVIEAGGVNYDAVCPSDYMIQKMKENEPYMQSKIVIIIPIVTFFLYLQPFAFSTKP